MLLCCKDKARFFFCNKKIRLNRDSVLNVSNLESGPEIFQQTEPGIHMRHIRTRGPSATDLPTMRFCKY